MFCPRPQKLITVPTCDECNEGTWKDDEYLRVALALRSESAAHHSMVEMRPTIARSLDKPEAQGFARDVMDHRISREWHSTPAGLVVPVVAHLVDHEKIERTIERSGGGSRPRPYRNATSRLTKRLWRRLFCSLGASTS
jgi:hypothetical protein